MRVASLVALLLLYILTSSDAFSFKMRSLKHASSVGTCGVSELGYQCYLQVCDNIAMHWSLGGAPPSLPGCSYPAASASVDAGSPAESGALNISAEVIHIALVTDLNGYVAMSLPQVVEVMCPADSVIAFIHQSDGMPSVGTYILQEMNAVPDSSYRVSDTSIESNDKGLRTCFSRPVAAVGKAGTMLSLYHAVGMNFAAALRTSSDLHQHVMDSGHLCGGLVQLVAKSIPGGEFGMEDEANPHSAVVSHGVLMILAWLVLLPLGVMSARHRWLFPASNTSASNSHSVALWFTVHQALQLSGIVLFTIGFVLPWTMFGKQHGDSGQEDSLMKSHGIIGITMAVLTYAQLLLAFLRPKPDARYRKWWNLQHWFTGRSALVLAIINITIGVQVFHEAWLEPKAYWYLALTMLLALFLGGAVFLEIMRYRKAGWQQLPAQDVSGIPVSYGPGFVQMKSMPGGSRGQRVATSEESSFMLPYTLDDPHDT
ncbi:hypothetical protein CEUSTIGMA_g7368.t1 [Chlamydomonas eustigma]|uniref:Cytochrome b561 domain-containing protein n=1 Tax=Chlamydomonas eustigma TaxID=1157962 RepID=A0A250XA21_9CHLO|nr:hypothetical protein CEUSTIGMA_g7368.t1 [Chlamydomonas eustigma]|eukprot:GAX79928.1 hypothetical protein CEUSTIGMA_g7368.t1 [Chlamydomonas eustigma]